VKGKEKNMNIVNLTPHSITILNEAKEIVQVVSRSGKVARLDINKELIPAQKEGYFNHKIPFFFTKYGRAEGGNYLYCSRLIPRELSA
jgi:hypothetical protein